MHLVYELTCLGAHTWYTNRSAGVSALSLLICVPVCCCVVHLAVCLCVSNQSTGQSACVGVVSILTGLPVLVISILTGLHVY